MTNPDSTEFALDALPLSPHPLRDFDCFHHIRCPYMQPLLIAPPPEWTVFGPEGNLFQPPIQLIPLAPEQNQVRIGLYIHPSLRLFRGQKPDATWRKDREKVSVFHPSHLSISVHFLNHLLDDINQLEQLHDFFFNALDGMITPETTDFDWTTCTGLTRYTQWLREHQKALKDRIYGLCGKTPPENSQKETCPTSLHVLNPKEV